MEMVPYLHASAHLISKLGPYRGDLRGPLPVSSTIRQLDATGWALRSQIMPAIVMADSLNQRDADYPSKWISRLTSSSAFVGSLCVLNFRIARNLLTIRANGKPYHSGSAVLNPERLDWRPV
ncbi:MAG TPA: hypothetical protein VHZ55_09405 [Bryobacteraceae bacterium]|jgi:hypothetical protein|nr:hypothetical protein [Bryobacteraceae bacterium]